MGPLLRNTLAAGLLGVAGCVWAQASPSACASEPGATGLAQRLENLQQQMRRIEESQGAEQRRLMDLHLKSMQEGLRELRQRGASEPCRIEVMQAVMEQLLRHQLALQEVPAR